MNAQEADLEVIAALKAVAYDQAPPEWWETIEREVRDGRRLDQADDIYAEILIDVMAYALSPPPEDMAKHGDHDQSSHGNWATGRSETSAQKAARMGAEFEAKRKTGEPIDAIDELTEMGDLEVRRFVHENREALGLAPPYMMGHFTIDEGEILVDAVIRRKATQERNDMDFDDLEDDLRAHAQKTMTDYATKGTVMAAMPEGPALKVLEGDERAKSQFETGRSNGAFSPGVRAEMETAMYKVHPGVDVSQRHTYGYATLTGEVTPATAQYGNIRFELKPDVRSRTGITAGDSLGSPAVPIPMGSRPSQRAAHDASQGWGGDAWREYPNARAELFRYVEAQIQGGWSRRDVAKVYVPAAAFRGEVWAAADALGIPVEYY